MTPRPLASLLVPLLGVLLSEPGCAGGRLRIGAMGHPVPVDGATAVTAYVAATRGQEQLALPNARGVVVYVPGSAATTVLRALPGLAGLSALGFAALLVERCGVGPRGQVDRAAFERGADKPGRVADVRAVVRWAAARAPRGVPLILIGGSEGGDIAAAVAARDPAVTHLVLLASGGGISQAEELRLLTRRPGGLPGLRDEADLDVKLAQIRAAPRSSRRWLGLPYHRWSSYLWDPPVGDLLRRPLPVLAVHGEVDASVPVESARALVAAFAAAGRRDLRYVELAGVDHRLRHRATGRRAMPLVELAVLDWLGTNGVLTRPEVVRNAARVRRAHPEWFKR